MSKQSINNQAPNANNQTPNTNNQIPNANNQTPNTNNQIPNANNQTPNTNDKTIPLPPDCAKFCEFIDKVEAMLIAKSWYAGAEITIPVAISMYNGYRMEQVEKELSRIADNLADSNKQLNGIKTWLVEFYLKRPK
jgi:hypothetical protein